MMNENDYEILHEVDVSDSGLRKNIFKCNDCWKRDGKKSLEQGNQGEGCDFRSLSCSDKRMKTRIVAQVTEMSLDMVCLKTNKGEALGKVR